MTNLLSDLTVVQLKRALKIKQRIAELERELSSFVGDSRSLRSSARRVQGGRKKRRKMSAAARKKISLKAKARWARVRAAKA